MAIYHANVNVISRAAGHSALAAAAYRAGENLGPHKYAARDGVHGVEIMYPENAPEWVTSMSREELWQSVEDAEKRKDAQIARAGDFALPKELNWPQKEELTRDFVRDQFTRRGMIVDVAYHQGDDNDNDHIHILATMRPAEAAGWGKKERKWNDKQVLHEIREGWANAVNAALERAGRDERVDHRSNADRGIDRAPQVHQGRYWTALKKQAKALDDDIAKIEARQTALAAEIADLEAQPQPQERPAAAAQAPAPIDAQKPPQAAPEPEPQPRPSPPQQPVMPVPAQTQTPQGAEYPSEPQTPEQQRADAALRDMLMALARRASMIDGWGDNNPHYRAAPTMLRSIIHDVLQQPRDERERYINDVVLRDEQRDTLPDYIALYQRNVVADGIIPVGKPATVQATHQAAQTAALPPEPPQTPPAVETGRELEREITATTPTPAPESQQQQPNQPELDEEMNDDLEEEPERPIQRPHSKPYASPTPAAPTAAPQPVMPVPPQTQAPPEPETQKTPTKAQPEMPTPAIPPEQTARDARLQAAIRAEEDWDRQQATAVPPADLEEAIRRARRGASIRYHADLARQGEEAPYGTRAEQAIIAAAEDRAWEAWSQAQERPAAAAQAPAPIDAQKPPQAAPEPEQQPQERPAAAAQAPAPERAALIAHVIAAARGGADDRNPHYRLSPSALRPLIRAAADAPRDQRRDAVAAALDAMPLALRPSLPRSVAAYVALAKEARIEPLPTARAVAEAKQAQQHDDTRERPAARTRDRGWGR